MSVQIVRATVNEVQGLAPLFNAYRTFYKQPSDLKAAAAFLQERLEKEESVVFLALTDGIPAGFTQLYPIFSSVSLKRAWILNDLFVDPAHRKKGVGKALLQKAREWGRETNSKWLMLQTQMRNFNAQHLYESDGWEKETDLFYRFDL